ncbi:MAG: hypothetical protein NZ700_10710 [Gemmataceae bacterium]|nr:hypothetical protein [Gemmataceae bacterium]MDW8264223.1 hypothetical protein [Gemmataceae bacterium]
MRYVIWYGGAAVIAAAAGWWVVSDSLRAPGSCGLATVQRLCRLGLKWNPLCGPWSHRPSQPPVEEPCEETAEPLPSTAEPPISTELLDPRPIDVIDLSTISWQEFWHPESNQVAPIAPSVTNDWTTPPGGDALVAPPQVIPAGSLSDDDASPFAWDRRPLPPGEPVATPDTPTGDTVEGLPCPALPPEGAEDWADSQHCPLCPSMQGCPYPYRVVPPMVPTPRQPPEEIETGGAASGETPVPRSLRSILEGEEESTAPQSHIDTMEFRPSDALPGSFDPQPF